MPLLEERCPKDGVVVSYRTAPRRHFSALPRATNGRPYNRIPPLLSVFPRHPSVDFVDSSPRWEPYMPLLEERCPKGGVVASYRTASRRHFSAIPWATDGRPYNRIPPLLSVFPRHPSVDFVDSSPRWEPYMPLLEERCPKGGVVASCGTAPLTSLFSTAPKFKKEKSVTSLFYYSPYLTP